MRFQICVTGADGGPSPWPGLHPDTRRRSVCGEMFDRFMAGEPLDVPEHLAPFALRFLVDMALQDLDDATKEGAAE